MIAKRFAEFNARLEKLNRTSTLFKYVSNSGDYIITSVSASTEQRCNSVSPVFQAPFVLAMRGPLSLRGMGLPYYSSPGKTALDSLTRSITYPDTGGAAAITGSWVAGKS